MDKPTLRRLRVEAAEKEFAEAEFARTVKDTGPGWEEDGDRLAKVVFWEGEGDQPSTKGRFQVDFVPGEATVACVEWD